MYRIFALKYYFVNEIQMAGIQVMHSHVPFKKAPPVYYRAPDVNSEVLLKVLKAEGLHVNHIVWEKHRA